MSKVICNQVDFVFITEIESLNDGIVLLTSAGVWKTFDITRKPVYSSETSQANPGPIRRETLTVQTGRNPDGVLHLFSNFPIIIRLHTDDGSFYMGSLPFPVITEITSDHAFDNYTFNADSIP